IIFYKLRLSDLPINPERVWKGKVESVYSGCVLISSLDTGYEGLHEAVWFSQIVTVERKSDVAGYERLLRVNSPSSG
ncbi:MAG: hypothetical protein ACJ788_26745, partial [Ktedonobacteraceae bacterium]